ncbi:MAG: hypothetical protein M0P61_17385 [Ignavibacteriaceae bacterium]|nr:hypothetical protein [Ignavibacteriaceae bacterium]
MPKEQLNVERIPNENSKREKNLELARDLFAKENFRLNNKDFELYGVAHIPETMQLYHKELESAIARAGIVVVEGGPDVALLFSALENADMEKDIKDEIRTYLSFYNQISELAGSHEKTVFNIDPVEGGEWEDDRGILAHEIDIQTLDIKSLISAGLPISLVVMVFRKKLQEAAKKVVKKEISRRAFIGGTVAALTLGSLGSLSLGADFLNRKTDKYAGRDENPLGAFLYNIEDYRDVVVSEGLEDLSKSNVDGPIVVIYGRTHLSGLVRYALSPRERQTRRSIYKPYEKVLKPIMRKYEPRADNFSGHTKIWVQVASKNI